MTVKYSIISRKNPLNPSAPAKYYPSVKAAGRSNLRRIATRISEMSSLANADTLAVLECLLYVIPQELADGRIVELGDFGTYRLIVRTSGSEDSQDVNHTNILKARANFMPGKEFRKALARVDYQREVPGD